MKGLFFAVIFGFLSMNTLAQVDFSADVTSGCAPLMVNFTNSSSVGVNFVWNFNDGSNSDTSFNASHNFVQGGYYWVSLYAYDASWVYQGEQWLQIDVQGASPIYLQYDSVCPGDEVYFQAPSMGNSYDFDFGDGSTEIGTYNSGVPHSYGATGDYALAFTVHAACGSFTSYDTIHVVTGLSFYGYAYMGLSVDSVCPGEEFYAYTNNGYEIDWDFGDGNFDSVPNPVHSYASLGDYYVNVTLTNGCNATTQLTDSIRVSSNVPVGYVYMYNSADTACPNTQMWFQGNAPMGSSYSWNFGDGSPVENDQYVNHAFSSFGTYNVQLTVTNSCGNDSTINKQIVINNAVQIQSASMYLNRDEICPGEEIYISLDNYPYSEVNFGDGIIASNQPSYNHSYSNFGEYQIALTYTNHCGNSFTIYDTVTVTNNLPFTGYASIYMESNQVCPGAEARMWPNANAVSYFWTFGDGFTSAQQQAEHVYSSTGTYPVSLTLTNSCGSDTVIYDTITVASNVPVNNIQFDLPDSICPGENFQAYVWANNASTYAWNFMDGNPPIIDDGVNYQYASIGSHQVEITLTSYCGLDSIVTLPIEVSNNVSIDDPQFSLTNDKVCPGDQVQFNFYTRLNYYIDFGDGSGSSNAWQHSYELPGVYPITLTIQNTCGKVLVVRDTVLVQNGLGFNPSNVYANAWPNVNCVNTPFRFGSNSGYSSYLWNFGDGNTSSNRNTEHGFASLGTHVVSLTITNGCGADTTLTVSVQTVGNLPLNGLEYEILGDSICPGDQLFFNGGDDGNGDGIFYSWDFGDGATSDENQTTHSYDNLGWHYITLNAHNNCNADTVIVDSVFVGNNVSASGSNYEVFVQQEGCIGDQLYFVLNPSGAVDISWDFGDGASSNVTQTVDPGEMNPVDVVFHAYSAPGNYMAVYTVTNGCGNSYSDSLLVKVGGIGAVIDVEATFWWDQSKKACQGQPVEFTAVGGATYIWNFGDGTGTLITYNSLAPVPHVFNLPGTYTVTLETYNRCGNSDTRSQEIYIPNSKVNLITNAVVDSDCGVNNGMAVVSASGGTPPYTYAWTNGDNSVIADSLYSGVYVVAVTDANGCATEAMATVSDEQGPTILLENIVHNRCYGQNNGSISVSILGGSPPYDISWSNGAHTEDIFALVSGPYELFVKDANGCFAVKTFYVNQPNFTNISIITTPATCGLSDGKAKAVINNGTGPFNYIWPNTSGMGMNQTQGLTPGIKELMVIDANTCLHRKTFVVNESGAPVILVDSIVTGSCNGNLSSVYINPIAGTEPYLFNWSDGSTNEDLVGVLPGNFEVKVTGADGCRAWKKFEVSMAEPEQNPICLVTVDSATGTNRIVWEPIQSTGVEYYNIYKESSQSGLYYLIGSSLADSISQFDDVNSDPTIRSWRYRIAAVDNCGNESEWSESHKTIHLSANLGIGGVVNLMWDHYQGFNYPTYYINRYHPSTGWLVIDSVPSSNFTYTDQLPPSDSNLIYTVEIPAPFVCTAQKIVDHNNTRSNKGIIGDFDTDSGTDTTANIGINESAFESIVIQPNPNNGKFELAIGGLDVNFSLLITDLRGEIVYRLTNTSQNRIAVDMGNFADGMYFLIIESGNNKEVKKIIKH